MQQKIIFFSILLCTARKRYKCPKVTPFIFVKLRLLPHVEIVKSFTKKYTRTTVLQIALCAATVLSACLSVCLLHWYCVKTASILSSFFMPNSPIILVLSAEHFDEDAVQLLICRAMLCISAVYAVVWCPSVPSVRHVNSWTVSKRISISSNFFTIG